MALGVRSIGNSILIQNVFIADNLPNKIPAIKTFAKKVLEPAFLVKEGDCKTRIGRALPLPEYDILGLIELFTNQPITDSDIDDAIRAGKYILRVRDSGHCATDKGVCAKCAHGYLARVGIQDTPPVGSVLQTMGTASSYVNYLAGTYSGAAAGYSPITEEVLPGVPSDWSEITTHHEMDGLCRSLREVGLPSDDFNYLMEVEGILERALLLISTYGVYGNA